MSRATRTAQEWFEAAAHEYVEGHQACAWCGGRHRVFKTAHGSRLEYQCSDCDFYVSHDEPTGDYVVEPGNAAGAAHEAESPLSWRGCFGTH